VTVLAATLGQEMRATFQAELGRRQLDEAERSRCATCSKILDFAALR